MMRDDGEVVVSIVIPVKDGEVYLRECLESCLCQTHSAIEVLVVDDGSIDGSRDIVNRLTAKDDRVQLLRHPDGENRGVSQTRWLGVSRATGEYVAFLDADDVFEPEKLARQVALMRQHRDCILCHTGVTVIGDCKAEFGNMIGRHFNGLFPTTRSYQSNQRPDAVRSNVVCNSTVMVRRSALEGVPMSFRQLFQNEDFFLWTWLSLRGDFLFIKDRLLRYRLHSDCATADVVRKPLVRLYSHMEFLLLVIALVPDEATRLRAQAELSNVLVETMCEYGKDYPRSEEDESGEGPVAGLGACAMMLERDMRGPFWEEITAARRELKSLKTTRTWRLACGLNRMVDMVLGRRDSGLRP